MKQFTHSLIGALILCLAFAAASFGQSTIRYAKLGPTVTGLAGYGSYTGGNADSVMTVVKATGMIGTDVVWQASEYNTSSPANRIDYYEQSQSVLSGWKAAYSFTKGSGLGALFHYTVTREVIDTGTIAIGTTSGGTFVVTGVIISGNNDTTGYTSNATVKVGWNASTYDNLCASATPTLGAAGTVSATVVSPRKDVPSGSTIYLHVTTAAVATTETINADVWGFYR